MVKFLKSNALQMARDLGMFGMVARSRWRQQRLLILGYHGLSLKDEHEWSGLFITPAFFRARLEVLARLRYQVLLLDRKSTRLNSSHLGISYAVFCLKKT